MWEVFLKGNKTRMDQMNTQSASACDFMGLKFCFFSDDGEVKKKRAGEEDEINWNFFLVKRKGMGGVDKSTRYKFYELILLR